MATTKEVFPSDAIRQLLGTFIDAVPTANSFSGKTGQYSLDENYTYVCYANNLWNRFAKTSW